MHDTAVGLSRAIRGRFAGLFALLSPREDDLPDHRFSLAAIAELHRITGASGASLDTQTSDDLLLHQYLSALSGEASLFGQQALYQRLHAGLGDGERAALRERVRLLARSPSELAQLHTTLRSLRHARADVAALLFEDVRTEPPAWIRYTWVLPLALLASLAAMSLSPLALLGAGLVLYLLMSIQMRYDARIQVWGGQVQSLQMLLRVQSLLGAQDGLHREQFAGGRKLAGRLNRCLSRSAVSNVPGAAAYADWFLLANVSHYFKSIDLVFSQREFLRETYLLCANLEADVALARHLLATPSWCWVERGARSELLLEQAVHPLLDGAAPLSIGLEGKGGFISGQNGVGKSTFLRTVGLSLVAARAFGFCYAQRARLPAVPVYTSMQSEDSLAGGESLYIAELRRARELLASVRGADAGIYLIDEIFRGTNHLESVSAAAAVLDSLAEHALVIVSSHNLVLAPLLAQRIDPYVIKRAEGGLLTLERGILAEPNGIALLAAHGFGPEVEAKAVEVARRLSSSTVATAATS